MCIGFIETQFTCCEKDPGEVVALSHKCSGVQIIQSQTTVATHRRPHTQGLSLSPPPIAPGPQSLDWPRPDISYVRNLIVAASVMGLLQVQPLHLLYASFGSNSSWSHGQAMCHLPFIHLWTFKLWPLNQLVARTHHVPFAIHPFADIQAVATEASVNCAAVPSLCG